METYIIRVNGREYVVEVEKVTEGTMATTGSAGISQQDAASGSQPGPSPAQVQKIQTTAVSAQGEPKKEPTQSSGTPVTTGTAGKVWKITGSAGNQVKRGDTVLILEAMKMEIPVAAPVDGTIGEILVAEGDSVETGQTIATIL